MPQGIEPGTSGSRYLYKKVKQELKDAGDAHSPSKSARREEEKKEEWENMITGEKIVEGSWQFTKGLVKGIFGGGSS